MSYCKPRRIQIGSNHPCPRPLGQIRQDQADRTLSDYQNGLPGLQTKGLNTFDAGIHRLDKTSLFEADAIRDANRPLLDNPVHHPDVFREASTGRLEARRTAPFLILVPRREVLVRELIPSRAGIVINPSTRSPTLNLRTPSPTFA